MIRAFTFRRSPKTLVAAFAMVVGMSLFGAASHAPSHASAATDNFFKPNIHASYAFKFQLGATTYTYFNLTNTGISDGYVTDLWAECGVHYFPQTMWEFADGQSHWYNVFVPAGGSQLVGVECTPSLISNAATYGGAYIFGNVPNNLGPTSISAQYGY